MESEKPGGGAAPATDDWGMADAPALPHNGGNGPELSTAPDVIRIPNTKGWKPTRDYPKPGSHVVSPEGVKYVMVKKEEDAHVIVEAKSGPVYLRRMEEGDAKEPEGVVYKDKRQRLKESKRAAKTAAKEPDEDAALKARNKVREKKRAGSKPADSPGKGRGHGGRAKGERQDYSKMSDAELKAWATKRQPWFMTRARQIEIQGVTGFRERVAKLMGVGVPGSRSKSKATKAAAPADSPTPAPKPVSKATAKREAAKAERKARKG